MDSITAGSLTFHIKMHYFVLMCNFHNAGVNVMMGQVIRVGLEVKCLLKLLRKRNEHCYAHVLNLAIGETIKCSKICCDALDVAFEISKFINFSPKRNAAFDQIRVGNTAEQECIGGIQTFCPTRWTAHGKLVATILDNFHNLKQLWDACLETRLKPEVKGQIIGVKVQMCKHNLLFGLKLCESILLITDKLSMTLQKESMSANEAQEIVKLTFEGYEK